MNKCISIKKDQNKLICREIVDTTMPLPVHYHARGNGDSAHGPFIGVSPLGRKRRKGAACTMNKIFQAVKVADSVYWVGAIDWNIRDFHGYTTTRGTTYNAYVILSDRVTLIDMKGCCRLRHNVA
jgi:hypothetical protein